MLRADRSILDSRRFCAAIRRWAIFCPRDDRPGDDHISCRMSMIWTASRFLFLQGLGRLIRIAPITGETSIQSPAARVILKHANALKMIHQHQVGKAREFGQTIEKGGIKAKYCLSLKHFSCFCSVAAVPKVVSALACLELVD